MIRDSWGASIHDGVERPLRDEDIIRRDHRGRPYVITPSGKERTYSRVTSYIKTVADDTAIRRWEDAMLAKGFAMEPDVFSGRIMQAQYASSSLELRETIDDARRRAGAKDAPARGTATHALTERYDSGMDLGVVPPKYDADLKAWIEVTKRFTNIHIERFVVNDDLPTAGTPDRVFMYRECSACGRSNYIGDLKTGRVDHYTELSIAMQLGVYSRSQLYSLDTGDRTPIDDLCLCRGIVIHLPAGTGVATLKWVDISRGWGIVDHLARGIHRARKTKGLIIPFDAE